MADQSNDALIEIEGLDFAYPGVRAVFENLSLTFDAGRFYLIRGASGAGKSTLLRLLIRLEDADSGDIRFRGRRLVDFPPERLRREILYVQQTPTVTTGTVRENLLLPFRFRANSDLAPPDDELLSERLQKFLLDDVGLGSDAKRLSVGQLQRLCLIRGLLLAPRVVLLDEPASALDETSRQVVEETAERLCTKDGLTVIMVSHRGFKPVSVQPVTLRVSQSSLERIE
jgi:putative ABC transport system ATP-binding protein